MSKKPLLSLNEFWLLVAAFLLFRLSVLWLFNSLANGQELASDVLYHKMIIDNPLGILEGTAFHIASYPPFQWVVEWPLYTAFFTYFSEMISIRLVMLTVELAAFVVLLEWAKHHFTNRVMVLVAAILFIISPHQYLASLIFVQEDVISQLFILLAVSFLMRSLRMAAIATMVAGVLTAKIFFIIPLFYVVMFYGDHSFVKRIRDGLIALTPIIFVYWLTISNALVNGGEVPIRDFTPNAEYAANYWVLILKSYPSSLELVKHSSLVLSVLFQVLVILVFFNLQYRKNKQIEPVTLMLIPLFVFFATFYQHMPEYFLMLWPLVAIYCTKIWQHFLFAAAFSFAWVPRFTHGLQTIRDNFGTEIQARTDVLGTFVDSLIIEPDQMNQIALVIQTVAYTLLLIFICRLAWRAHLESKRVSGLPAR